MGNHSGASSPSSFLNGKPKDAAIFTGSSLFRTHPRRKPKGPKNKRTHDTYGQIERKMVSCNPDHQVSVNVADIWVDPEKLCYPSTRFSFRTTQQGHHQKTPCGISSCEGPFWEEMNPHGQTNEGPASTLQMQQLGIRVWKSFR